MILDLTAGVSLEEARRAPPLDDKGHSLRFAEADREYQDWLRLHGRLLLDELAKGHPDRCVVCGAPCPYCNPLES